MGWEGGSDSERKSRWKEKRERKDVLRLFTNNFFGVTEISGVSKINVSHLITVLSSNSEEKEVGLDASICQNYDRRGMKALNEY